MRFFEEALKDLDKFLKETSWFGREREVVNLFAHKFLPNYLGREGFLFLEQIGIEVALIQVETTGKRKKMVNKDLVIWQAGNSSAWKETKRGIEVINIPMIVSEWKVNNLESCTDDIEWLKKFTTQHPSVIGYSVCAFVKGTRGVIFYRIEKGKIREGTQ